MSPSCCALFADTLSTYPLFILYLGCGVLKAVSLHLLSVPLVL